MRVLTIFLRTGTDSYQESESQLDQLFATQLPGVAREVVIVDNALAAGLVESRPGRSVIGGDNSASEWSAIDAALAHVGRRVASFDLVNVVTAAFRQLYVAYLERFTPPVLEAIAGQRVCLGHIDCYNEEIGILTYRSQHWLRTSFIMLPPGELRLLGSTVSVRHRWPWFSGRSEAPFAADAPISQNYRKYILDWLLGEDIGQGVRWHKRLSLEGEGLAVFERKTLAILNEHLLGIRLRAAGCRVIDVTWLSTELAAGRRPDWTTPWWIQLAGRDRDRNTVTVPGPPFERTPTSQSAVHSSEPRREGR
jgi:hypothetical protein